MELNSKNLNFFSTFRQLNRRRNHFTKHIRYITRFNIARLAFDKKTKSEFPCGEIKSVLLVRNEGAIGDLVVDSALVKVLHDNGYLVDFLVTKGNKDSIRYNPYIRNVYESIDVTSARFNKSFSHNVPTDVMKALAAHKYDLLVDPSVGHMPIHRFKMIKEINPKNVIGFNKSASINLYNKSVSFDTKLSHVSDVSVLVCGLLNIKLESRPKYDIHLPKHIINDVASMDLDGSKLVIINIHASIPERSISQKQLSALLTIINDEFSDLKIVLLDHNKKITIPLPSNVLINPFSTIHHAAALLHLSNLIISPDTSIVHYAASWSKNLISIYRDIPTNNVLWAPGYSNASQMILPVSSISSSIDLPDLIVSEIRERGLL